MNDLEKYSQNKNKIQLIVNNISLEDLRRVKSIKNFHEVCEISIIFLLWKILKFFEFAKKVGRGVKIRVEKNNEKLTQLFHCNDQKLKF